MEKDTSHSIWLQASHLLLLAMLFLFMSPAYAQTNRTIHGIVVDENNEPLPAAHVKQVSENPKGSIAAIITDIQGHFSLTLPNNAKEIEVSYLGYETQRVKLTANTEYHISLKPATERLMKLLLPVIRLYPRNVLPELFQKLTAKSWKLNVLMM